MIVRSKHQARAFLLLVIGLAGFFVVRALLIPPTWGEQGNFRFANLAEQRAKPVVHGGRESCKPCHEKRYKENRAGVHKTVHCEGCHGPVAWHADQEQADGPDKGKIADMPINESWRLCARCHEKMQARAKKHPQIDIDEHLKENDAERTEDGTFADNVCKECHDPHSPAE